MREYEEQKELLDRQRRERKEREREQKEEVRLRQLRLELLNYDFHTCPKIKKEAFQNLEVDDVDLIRIALIGPTGSGKTSLVGKSGCFLIYHFIYLFSNEFFRYPSADCKTLCLRYSMAPKAYRL